MSIFFAFVLFASSLSVAKPVQSQQQPSVSTDSVLQDIQKGVPPLTQPSQVQQPQQAQDIGNDFVNRFNRQIYSSGQPPAAAPPSSQQITGSTEQPSQTPSTQQGTGGGGGRCNPSVTC